MTRTSILAVAGIACLLATTATVRGDAPPKNDIIKTSVATSDMCRFPFYYNGRWWHSCISSVDAPKPWCVLKEKILEEMERKGDKYNNWLNCDMDKVPTPTIIINGKSHICLQKDHKKAYNVTMGGCNTANEEDKIGQCQIEAGGPEVTGSCSLTKFLKDGDDDGAMAGLAIASADPNDDKNKSKSGQPPIAAIAGVMCSVVIVGLLAGLFVYRRRQSRQNLNWQYQDKVGNQMESNPVGAGFNVAAAAAAAEYRDSTASSQMFSPISPGERMYPVISTYTPTLGDELEIQPGDKVSILIEYDDGWCQGVNHTRGGLKGVFPRHCVDMTAGVPIDDSTTRTSANTSSAGYNA